MAEEKYIYEESDQNRSGLTFREYARFVWKKKIVCLIILVAVFVVSFVGLFIFRKSSGKYTSDFNLNWYRIENSQYPNGSTFNYKNLISESYLEEIKNSKSSFSNINTKKLLQDISLTQNIKYYDDDNKTAGYYTVYSLTIKKSNFNSKDQATDFFSSLVQHQLDYVKTSIIDKYSMDNALNTIIDSSEYDVVFSAINTQMESLRTNITNLINSSSGYFVYDSTSGATLINLQEELTKLSYDFTSSNISSQYITSYYVRNVENYKSKFENELASIDKQIEENNAILTQLETKYKDVMATAPGTYTSDAYVNAITPYITSNEKLKIRREYVTECLSTPTFNQEYNNKVQSYIDSITTLTNKTNSANKAVNTDKLKVTYHDDAIIRNNDTISTPILVAVPIVLAIGVPLLVMYFWANYSNNDKNLNKDTKETKEVK